MESVDEKRAFEIIHKINDIYKSQEAARVMANVAEGDKKNGLKYANMMIKYHKHGMEIFQYMKELELLLTENKSLEN